MNKIGIIAVTTVLALIPKYTALAAAQSEVKNLSTTHISAVLSQTGLETKVPYTLSQASIDIKPVTLKEKAKSMVDAAFGPGYFTAFDKIVTHESNWDPSAVNPSSGAFGLGQALPATQIKNMSEEGQLEWMIAYIADRYGNPKHAWAFWQAHNWY
jgi:hypothetical protein